MPSGHCRSASVCSDSASRKNAKPWKDKKVQSLERNELLKIVKRLGKNDLKRWSGYHSRSLVETKMHCMDYSNKLGARNLRSLGQRGTCPYSRLRPIHYPSCQLNF